MMIDSHPEQSLEEHLRGILNYSLSQMNNSEISDKFRELIFLTVLYHDFGKSTRFFQEYIHSKEKRKTPLSRHTLISAITGYYIAKNNNFDEFQCLCIYLSILRHHSNLENITNTIFEITTDNGEKKELLLKQVDAILFEDWNQIQSNLTKEFKFNNLNYQISKDILNQWIENFFTKDIRELKKTYRNIKKSFNENNLFHNYLKLNLLFSTLIDADKIQAAFQQVNLFNRFDINSQIVDKFLQSFDNSSDLNQLRTQAYNEVNKSIDNPSGNIFTITLPTGLGKTLTSFKAALKLRELRESETGIKKRIIYSLPFLSVIEQNHSVIEKVLEQEHQIDNNLLLKHHSLIDYFYETEDDEFKYSEANLLIESWNSEIIITTFIQLFHTLINNKNRALKKFNKIYNSIIIIDEIQSVPVKFWKLLEHLFINLSKEMNADIILLTATQPEIIPNDKAISLCETSQYFEKINRYELQIDLNPMTIENFLNDFTFDKNKSYLFILNTINSSIEFLERLQQIVEEPVAYLSTNIIPKDRLERINDIKNGKYRFAVTTQMVEAGVDIDFDIVVRDLSPFDSIIQSAGRCNRNFKNNLGIVKIINLVNDNERAFSKIIYDSVLIDCTKNILSKFEKIEEKEIFKHINEYFKLIKERKSQEQSDKYLKAIQELYYTGEINDKIPISNFQLIENSYNKIDVFIEKDEKAQALWKKFEELKSISNPFERKNEFYKIKKEFNNYLISIPINVENKPILTDYGIGYVSNSQINDYYDELKGYKKEIENLFW